MCGSSDENRTEGEDNMNNAMDFTKSVLFEAYAERIGKRSAEDLFRRLNRWQELAGSGKGLWEAYDAAFVSEKPSRSDAV